MKKIALAAIALIGLAAPAFAGSFDSAGPTQHIQTMHLVDKQRPAAHNLVVPVHSKKSRSRGGYGGYRGGYGGYRGGYGYRGGGFSGGRY